MPDTPVRPMLETPNQQEVKMSARGVLSVVGTAVGGLIGWTATPPAADPSAVRRLLEDLGLTPGPDLAEAVRAFQARTGLAADGVAGAETVHLLARYAVEARELRRLDLAA
jgi:murein L,D-transpeptidase YcbB/YkuD